MRVDPFHREALVQDAIVSHTAVAAAILEDMRTKEAEDAKPVIDTHHNHPF